MGTELWAVIVAGVAGLIPALVGTWLRHWMAGRRLREQARCDHVHHLPPGSRVVDLGRHGMVIEVGGRCIGAAE